MRSFRHSSTFTGSISSAVRRILLVPGALLLLPLLSACQPESPADVRRDGGQVMFVGIDGLSWKVIGPMLEAGELPNLRRLTEEGAYAPRFETMSSTSSPVVWTTVATGRTPAEHGVTSFVERLADGQVIPVSGASRKVKAIWEVATDAGVSVGVIGWWASWPADPVNGYVVSDHANPALASYLVEDRRYWTADSAALEALNRDVYPPEMAGLLRPFWIETSTFDYGDLQRRGGFSAAQMELLESEPWNHRSAYSLLKTFYLVDQPHLAAALELRRTHPVQLQLLYLRGPDPIQHYGWDLVEPQEYSRPPEHLARDRGLVEGVYRYLDSFLGEILRDIDDDTWLIVASDHGAEPVAGAHSPGFRGRPGGHGEDAKGVFFLRGPGVRKGYRLDSGDPRDLMPTMAWLAGLPLSKELAGRPLSQAFDPAFARRHPRARVETYGEREQVAATASEADEGLLESLRALGYIN